MTYSIVARDPETGDFGVAVQSKFFSVGPIVTWAEPAVGAVATQAMGQPSYGALGLDLMRNGLAAQEVLPALLAADPQRDQRQVAMVDAEGRVAAHTGTRCIAEAGHATGDGYSCQANIMRKDTVWPAMAEAFEGGEGPLAERLLAALDAAEKEGGDARGRQSAALLVVPATGLRWEKTMELRVEDHADPNGELRRLVSVRRRYEHYGDVMGRVRKGDGTAIEELEEFSDDTELAFGRAVALAMAGRTDEAATLFADLVVREPAWRDLPARYDAAGVLPRGAYEAIKDLL